MRLSLLSEHSIGVLGTKLQAVFCPNFCSDWQLSFIWKLVQNKRRTVGIDSFECASPYKRWSRNETVVNGCQIKLLVLRLPNHLLLLEMFKMHFIKLIKHNGKGWFLIILFLRVVKSAISVGLIDFIAVSWVGFSLTGVVSRHVL